DTQGRQQNGQQDANEIHVIRPCSAGSAPAALAPSEGFTAAPPRADQSREGVALAGRAAGPSVTPFPVLSATHSGEWGAARAGVCGHSRRYWVPVSLPMLPDQAQWRWQWRISASSVTAWKRSSSLTSRRIFSPT